MSCEDYPETPILWRQAAAQAHKGRGAVTNIDGRFEQQTTEAFDDGWPAADAGVSERARIVTDLQQEHAKSILTRNSSPDLPFSVSLNPYLGCEHGCIYCFARPTHSYLGLSPGLDFESQIRAKVNAPELLLRELAQPGYQPLPIALGVNTDAYQPSEKKLRLTRRLLEILHDCEHPVGLITKAALIERDIDLLAAMAAKQQAVVTVTITTLDHGIARLLEPRAAAPKRRLQTVRRLTDAGIPVGVNIAPIIPFITDSELERVIEACAEAGAISCSYIILRLPWEVSPLFQQWLESHFPDRAERVMNRVRDMRGGKDYDANFGTRMRGEGLWADLIKQRFQIALKRSGLSGRNRSFAQLDGSRFRRPAVIPAAQNQTAGQLDLFG